MQTPALESRLRSKRRSWELGHDSIKPVEESGRVLHDADLAEAILDRVLERGRVLHFKGPSYRMRHLRAQGVPMISGREATEYQGRARPRWTHNIDLGGSA